MPVTLVTSSSAPPSSEVTTPGGVLTNETVLSPLVGVLNARDEQARRGVGILTMPMMPAPGDAGVAWAC